MTEHNEFEGGEETILDDIEGLVCKVCVDKHPFLVFFPTEKDEQLKESPEKIFF